MDRARAGARAPIPKDAPPSRLAAQPKAQKTIVKTADFPVTLEGIWLLSGVHERVYDYFSDERNVADVLYCDGAVLEPNGVVLD